MFENFSFMMLPTLPQNHQMAEDVKKDNDITRSFPANIHILDFNQLLATVQKACSANSEERRQHSDLSRKIHENPYFNALRSVFEDEKRKIEQMSAQLEATLRALMERAQQMAVDTVENAEFFNGSNSVSPTVEQKLAECRAFCGETKCPGFEEEDSAEQTFAKAKMRECLAEYNRVEQLIEQDTNFCIENARQCLAAHARIRPITSNDLHRMESSIQLSVKFWRDQLRDAVCSHLLLLKAIGTSEKKKRQNFSAKTIAILNKYFHEHLYQPYPDEATKVALAEQCGITVAQVSNWFGNKRIRFRKAKKNEADKKKQKQGTSKMMLKKAKKEMNV